MNFLPSQELCRKTSLESTAAMIRQGCVPLELIAGGTDLLPNGNEREIALDKGEPFLERVTMRN
jgi:hypothetical protein